MPDLSVPDIGLLVLVAILAALAGWMMRSRRCRAEKQAVNVGWQHQMDAQQAENERLVEQGSSLMQQISQYRASNSDIRKRARELSDNLREAFERRDELQRQLRDIRSNLELVTSEQSRLQTDVATSVARQQTVAVRLKDRDEKIAKLKRELANWYERVPPLVERYRVRDRDAREFRAALDAAESRIAELERRHAVDETRIEPVERIPLPAGLEASNDQYDETSMHDTSGLVDQTSGTGDFSTMPGTAFRFDNEAETPRDDLQRIKGIGPAIERTLNDLGYCSYRQIASMTDNDIARIAARLRGFSGRIQRENWIDQARDLLRPRF